MVSAASADVKIPDLSRALATQPPGGPRRRFDPRIDSSDACWASHFGSIVRHRPRMAGKTDYAE
jgi:hypothetical protein